MKKIIFVFILVMMNSPLYSQSEAMRFLSMGFNARQDSRGDRVYTTYYFYGYEDYSEAFVYSDRVELSTDMNGGFYPNGDIRYGFSPNRYRRYTGQNNSVGYDWHVPTQGSYGLEYKFENGRLVYWASGDGLSYGIPPSNTLERVEQDNQSITIYYSISNNRIFSYRYYNISRTELLDIFLKKYVELTCEIIDIGNTNRRYDGNFGDNFDEYISLLIRGRTARELAIFRNCLYAIKGYRFSNSTWTEFFNKYLPNYNARYSSNDEVTAMLTDNEKWLLDLIIQRENRR